MNLGTAAMLSRAWYDASIADFLTGDPDAIIGRLTQASNVAVEGTQTTAWHAQIALLKPALAGLSGLVLFEFNIPRMGRRIDVILLIGSVIFVVEYKVGESAFERAAIDQVWDYALDLKNFHEGSHNVAVVPILVATEATDAPALVPQFATDGVCRPLQTTPARLRETIDQLLQQVHGSALDESRWLDAPYRPTPTIVEAARALYAQHSVEAIARHDAGAKNLHKTTRIQSQRFPMALTRDLGLAKQWIHDHARGTERYGLVASSKAMRLKPHAIDIRVAVDPIPWFLNDRGDTKSSFYLEDCATEFQVQGLELDWACVSWDGDLRHTGSGWSFHDFRGKKWQNVNNTENQAYLRNAYRVLLTRARQGMVVFIPPGDPNDHTRPPSYYDPTFRYLSMLGIPVLS